MLGTRPDLAFTVGALARFSSNPSTDHFLLLVRLLGFLKFSRWRYLLYESSNKTVDGYTNADFAGDVDGRKSTSGYAFYIGNTVFSWRSRLQDTVANSTMEAEYIALYHASLNAAWIRNFFEQLGMAFDHPIQIWCDNQPAINVAKGEAPHKKAKHFDVKVHVVRDHIQRQITDVTYVPTEENQADVFTKPLTRQVFTDSVAGLGLYDSPASPQSDIAEGPSIDDFVDAPDS